MAEFTQNRSIETNEIYMNLESDSDSDFFDDSDNEESSDSDDNDDLSTQNRSRRTSYFTPRTFEFTEDTGISSEALDLEHESPLDFFEKNNPVLKRLFYFVELT